MRFYGIYDTIPVTGKPNVYQYQQDYGFLRDDGLLIISPSGTYTDGASIPRFAWLFVGHPLYKNNKFWSSAHDALYSKTAIIIDTKRLDQWTIQEAFEYWELMPTRIFIHQHHFNRRFADDTLRQAMKELGENWFKRQVCYRAVRMNINGGWWSKER